MGTKVADFSRIAFIGVACGVSSCLLVAAVFFGAVFSSWWLTLLPIVPMVPAFAAWSPVFARGLAWAWLPLVLLGWLAWMGWSMVEVSSARSMLAAAGIPESVDELTAPPIPPANNAATLLAVPSEMLGRLEDSPQRPACLKFRSALGRMTAEDFDLVREELSRPDLAAFLKSVTDASLAIDYRPTRDYRQGPFIDIGPAASVLDFAKLLSLRSLVLARDGDQTSSAADILTISRLASLLRRDNIVIPSMVAVSSEVISVDAAMRAIGALGATPFSPSDWNGLDAAWKRAVTDTRPSLGTAVAVEARVMGWFVFERPIRPSEVEPALGLEPRTNEDLPSRGRLSPFMTLYRTLLRPAFNLDYAEYIEQLMKIRADILEGRGDSVSCASEQGQVPRWALFSRLLVPAMESLAQRSRVTEAWLKVGRVGLALERYRAENGSYPPSLSSLGLPAPETRDPFAEGEFAYLPDGDSVLLYSVGPDRVAQGGRVSRRWRDSDIAWKIRRTRGLEVGGGGRIN